MSLRMGSSVAGTIRSRVKDARLAQMLDHFTQYVGSSPYGSPAVLCSIAHMQVAEGVWYPMGGTRAVAEALHELAAEQGCELRLGEEVDRPASSRQDAGRGRAHRGRRRASRSTRSSPTWTRSAPTASWSAAPPPGTTDRKGYEPACSGVVLYLGLRPALPAPRPPRLRLLARPRGGVRLDLPPRRAGARPDLLRRRPVRHRPERGAAGRRGALRPGAHALPAAAPRLAGDVPGLPPGDPGQAEAHGGAATTSRTGSSSSAT